MLSIFNQKRKAKVFWKDSKGAVLFIVKTSKDGASNEFLQLQSRPKVYDNFVFSSNGPGCVNDKWEVAPGHITRLALSILPAYQEYHAVTERLDSIHFRLYGRRERPEGELANALLEEYQQCKASIRKFWDACDRLYVQIAKEMELDKLGRNDPNRSLSNRLDRLHELLDMFEENEPV